MNQQVAARLVTVCLTALCLVMTACGGSSQLGTVGETRKMLEREPDSQNSYEHDYSLFSNAGRLSPQELVLLEDDIHAAIGRYGVKPLTSFMIYYVDRMYFAQPKGWEGVAQRMIEAARKDPPRKDVHERRTIGILDYKHPIKTKVYSLQAANLFFCLAESEIGMTFMKSGAGPDALLDFALLLNHNRRRLFSAAVHDEQTLKLRAMLSELDGACDMLQDGYNGVGGERGSFGVKDGFLACVLDEAGRSEAAMNRIVDEGLRCLEKQMTEETNPLADDWLTDALVWIGEALGILDEPIERPAADVQSWTEYNECVSSNAAAKGCEAFGFDGDETPQLVGPKNPINVILPNGELKLYRGTFEEMVEDAKAGLSNAQRRLRGSVQHQLLPGGGEIDWSGPCLPPGVQEKLDKLREVYDPFAPGPDPLVSYTIDDPVDPWFTTGCGSLLFGMDDEMTQCMSGLLEPCAVIDPIPGSDFDYCDCKDSILTREEAQALTITYLTEAGACAVINCAEGFECVDGSCQPVVQESCISDLDPPGPGPDPATSPAGPGGVNPPLPDGGGGCGPLGLRSVSYKELLSRMKTNGIDITLRLMEIRELIEKRGSLPKPL